MSYLKLKFLENQLRAAQRQINLLDAENKALRAGVVLSPAEQIKIWELCSRPESLRELQDYLATIFAPEVVFPPEFLQKINKELGNTQ